MQGRKEIDMDIMKVFAFSIYYDGDWEAGFSPQVRYVLAETEEEAEKKLEQYNLEQHQKGFAPFHIIYNAPVEIDEVIV